MFERPVGWYDAAHKSHDKHCERIEERSFVVTHPNFGGAVEVACKNCVYYKRASIDAGYCRVNPPVIFVDRVGDVQSTLPETSADGMCAHFYANK